MGLCGNEDIIYIADIDFGLFYCAKHFFFDVRFVKFGYRGSKWRTHTNTICLWVYFSWRVVERDLYCAGVEKFFKDVWFYGGRRIKGVIIYIFYDSFYRILHTYMCPYYTPSETVKQVFPSDSKQWAEYLVLEGSMSDPTTLNAWFRNRYM